MQQSPNLSTVCVCVCDSQFLFLLSKWVHVTFAQLCYNSFLPVLHSDAISIMFVCCFEILHCKMGKGVQEVWTFFKKKILKAQEEADPMC